MTNKELGEEKDSIEVASISFKFPMTRDEAEAILKKPKGVVARKLRAYMNKILVAAAKKFVESEKDTNVNNCKLSLE